MLTQWVTVMQHGKNKKQKPWGKGHHQEQEETCIKVRLFYVFFK